MESEPLEILADKGIFKGSEKTCREEPVHQASTAFVHFIWP